MKRLLVLLLFVSVSSCSLFRNDFMAPDVALAGLRLGQGDGMYQVLLVDLVLTNPNASELKLNAISYRLKIDGRELAGGDSREPLVLPAGGSAKYTVPATINLMSSFGFVRDMLMKPKNKVAYELVATLETGGLFSMPLTIRKTDYVNLAQ